MIKSLAALRFVFAFLVFLHHIHVLEDAVGVAFFFMLSGFILTYVYGQSFEAGTINYSRFLKLRVTRLYPLYVLSVLAAIPLTIGIFKDDAAVWFGQLVLDLVLLQSFVPDANWYFSFNWLAWSISNLFLFYLLFPFFVSLLNRTPLKRIVVFFSISVLFILWLMVLVPQDWQHWFFYINPFLRLYDFGLGMLLYKILKDTSFSTFEKRFTYYEIASVVLLVAFYAAAPLFPKVLRYSVYYWFPMFLVVGVFAQQKGYISKLLSHKYLLFLGEISLGFYLWHQLVLRYAARLMSYLGWEFPEWIFNTACLLLILVVSTLSYRFFELPVKKKLRDLWL